MLEIDNLNTYIVRSPLYGNFPIKVKSKYSNKLYEFIRINEDILLKLQKLDLYKKIPKGNFIDVKTGKIITSIDFSTKFEQITPSQVDDINF